MARARMSLYRKFAMLTVVLIFGVVAVYLQIRSDLASGL
jgi:hypothetical protein